MERTAGLSVRMVGTRDHRMHTTGTLFRRATDTAGAVTLILDPALQGLPGAAHGGSVLAALDAAAPLGGIRRVSGVYRRRVPLGVPLALEARVVDGTAVSRLRQGDLVLAEGQVAAAGLPEVEPAAEPVGGTPLPISRTCFVCGLDNPAGLRAQLRFDEDRVFGAWTPPERSRAEGGGLAPLALTCLLDEAAFWLGALASGESGMTTHLAVTLADRVPADAPLAVSGARALVRPVAGDGRYWQTHTLAFDANGRVVASADITFVALRGAARKLGAWLSPLNPPGLMRRIFPFCA